MLILGHCGITITAARAADPELDARKAAALSLAPDLVDKPVHLLLPALVNGSGRSFAHSALGALAALGLLLLWRPALRRPLLLWACWLGHLALDRMWEHDNPKILFWPLLGPFPVQVPGGRGPADHVTLVYNLFGELVGLALLARFARRERLLEPGRLRSFLLTGAAAFLLLFLPARSEAGVRTVWAVNDGEKVDRDDLSNPNKASNSAWDGARIKLFGARNEVVSFQVIVESDEKGIGRISAALPRLSRRGGKASIVYAPPSGDPTLYAGRPIQVFSENYMHVSSATRADWIYRRDSLAAPQNPTGWKPVQLVPENARPGLGGFPLSVGPSRNAAFWFDVYLDRGLPAGVYAGAVALEADGARLELPIELELFDFALPDRNALDAMLYFEESQVRRYHGRDLEDRYRRFAHRQRVEFVGAADQASVRADRGRYDGKDFTRRRGYAGPGEGVGDRIAPASFYGPGDCCDDRAKAWRFADDWISFLDKTVPGAVTFLYMPDEPTPADYPRIRRIAENIHSDPGPGRRLKILATKEFVPELDGAVDIWDAPAFLFNPGRAKEERARGREYWVYNGGRPAAGAIVIDAPAVDARATAWECAKEGVSVYFYWHADHWRHNALSPVPRDQDVWSEPVTFDTRGSSAAAGGSFANGDGALVYPGEERLHPGQDRGVPGPVSTIQLANLRRGLQDALYLSLARERGLGEEADAALEAAVPRAFADAGPAGFAETGDAYEAQRYRLGKAIAAAARFREPVSRP